MRDENSCGRLSGRVAVITGGGSGIGEAAAKLFASEGACVAVADVDEAGGKRVVDQLAEKGLSSIFVKTNVSQKSHVLQLLERTAGTFGGIDLLVSNAGIQGPIAAAPAYAVSEWKKLMDINLTGSFYLCKYGIPYMKKRGGGSIVITGSLSAFDASGMTSAYAAAKAALCNLTKSIAYDYGKDNIRANAVCPAAVTTGLTKELMKTLGLSPQQQEAFKQRQIKEYPIGRVGTPEDIANLMLFLASDESAFLSGGNVIVDGGYWAGVPYVRGEGR